MAIEFLLLFLRKSWHLGGFSPPGMRYFNSCWTNYDKIALIWRYEIFNGIINILCISAYLRKRPNIPFYHSEAFNFFSFLKGNLSAQVSPTILFICSKKPCFSPLTQRRCLGYVFFYWNLSVNPQNKKKLDIMTLLLCQSLPNQSSTGRNLNIP